MFDFLKRQRQPKKWKAKYDPLRTIKGIKCHGGHTPG